MTATLPFRRALLAASPEEQPALRRSFADAALGGWEAAEADTWERIQFLLQHEPADVVLVDESFSPTTDVMAWLAGPRETPAVWLTRTDPAAAAAALSAGADVWLPRDLALGHTPLLVAGLEQAQRWGTLRQQLRLAGTDLRECRQHVHRLVELLWQSTPRDPATSWFTHRHMLERLQEELARSARYGVPFSVVLGEVRPRMLRPTGEAPRLPAWAAERIARVKRRCDIAGQYGPHGFMLLLANTSETGAATFCRRLNEAISRDALAEAVPVVASFGIAACSDPSATSPRLLRRAEEDLHSALARAESDRAP
jgi:GGDEF domain-containing protein